jgi:hypothetical protein
MLLFKLEPAWNRRQDKLRRANEEPSKINEFLLERLKILLPTEGEARLFTVSLKQLKGKRIDALYYSPKILKMADALKTCPYDKFSLGSLATLVGGATPTKGDKELYAESGVKFLRIMNVAPNEIKLDDVKYIQEKVHIGELARSQLAAGDVLMTITGRVGTAAVVPEEILPANINQHIVRLRIERDDCLPAYLAAYLNTPVGSSLSNRGVTGGTRIALDYHAVRSLQIPLPPLRIQKDLVEEIQQRRSEAKRLREEAAADWEEAKRQFESELLGA